jgi:hypothetical protein
MRGLRLRYSGSLLLASALFICARTAPAQPSRTTILDFATGSQYEDYLRALQVAGMEPLYPWSIRGLSARTISQFAEADSAGPWALKRNFHNTRFSLGSVQLGTTFNSSYPYGANDGPVWAGRGLTLIASDQIAGHLGPVSFTLAPIAFRASNGSFDLLDNGQIGTARFANGSFPSNVDYPQRFGDGSYSRVDPGASTIRFDSRAVTLGVSTANDWIGPATEFPFLLGDNAPGFPHIFIGTGDPWNLWFARMQSRVMWGKLDQSDFSPVSGSTHFLTGTSNTGTIRLATSAQIVFLPRGMPGLEIGFARFIHVPYLPGEPSTDFWKKPFKTFFLKNERASGDTVGADNQLASAFFRWVFPQSGFELYGERGYEDQFFDLRDLIQDPDHERSYMLGFQKTLNKTSTSLDVLKMEVINYQWPSIERVRIEGLIYVHGILRQGHTNRGQLLGAYPGVGAAAGSVISWTRYSTSGRSAFTLRRILRDDSGDFVGTGIVLPHASDVIVAVGAERMRFGRLVDYSAKIEAMQDYNRNFAKDVPNLNLQLTAQLHPW